VTTVAGVTAAAWTGLGLCNPTGSGIHIVVHEFFYPQDIEALAIGNLGLATTTDSDFEDKLTSKNRLIGGAASNAYVDDHVTLAVAGNIIAWVAGVMLGTEVTISTPPSVYDLGGALVLPPGYSVITNTSDIQAAVFTFGFMWEEVQSPFGR
jgi:hypothetical protein